MKTILIKSLKSATLTVSLLSALTASSLHAQTTTHTFGTGGNQFSLNFQTIGNTNNAADSTGYGAVGYSYSIGTYDISVNQLNAATANGVAGLGNGYGNWSADQGNGYWSGDLPAVNVSWLQAAAFVNWLNTSTGHQDAYNLTYSGGAYTMALWQSGDSGYNPSNPFRNSLALFVLPSENEWYKAAYYDPNANSGAGGYNLYPTGNSTPTAVAIGTNANTAVYGQGFYQGPASVYQAGGLSPYGTMGQGGNVAQWEESATSGSNTNETDPRVVRGGEWDGFANQLRSSSSGHSLYSTPDSTNTAIGFRVAEVNAVPEPSSYALCVLAGVIVLIARFSIFPKRKRD